MPVTDADPAAPSTGGTLPPDPAKYDAERNAAARRRGLQQPYIAGGEDPDLGDTLRRERPYVRLLLAMAVGLALLGFVLGVIGALLSGPAA